MAGAKKFVPRQRKHKVLARQRAAENGTKDVPQDSNAVEIVTSQELQPSSEREEKKAQLRSELRQDGVKVSGKKAKRLEKYIDNKLRKDENRELIAKLAAQKIDTSLFSSSRSLGQTKETKRQALSRALREQNAGLPADPARDQLLLEKRKDVEQLSSDESDGSEAGSDGEQQTVTVKGLPLSQPQTQVEAAEVPPPAVQLGAGLKRPLETGENGRPVLPKRQKRGGVQSKVSILEPEKIEAESEEWNGFSTDGDEDESEEAESKASLALEPEDLEDDTSEESLRDSHDEGDSGESGEEEDGGDSEDDNDDESGSDVSSDNESDNDAATRKERSSAFKAWAHQQRNEALGYQSVDSQPMLLDIPKPDNFKPRPLEQEPLPIELQPTSNTQRKAYSVAVTRSSEIQEARLQLPVVQKEHEIMEAIHNNDIVVICGATGSGKTTQVPQFLYEAGYGSPDSPTPGLIGVTQPRRVAAVSMSKRVAQELGDQSHTVAYQIRFEGTVDPKTAIKFMTDGVLLREVAQDIALRKYSAIVIDEAHERSVNTDILIGMLSRVIKLRSEMAKENPEIRPLKLVIMSATLRIEDMTHNPTLFAVPPRVLDIEGRQHPVTVHFARRTHHDYVEEAFRKVSRGHKKLPPGGFLVFVTGQNEIHRLMKRLKSSFGGSNTPAMPKVRISGNDAPIETEDIDFGDVDDRTVDDAHDEIDFEESDEEEDKEFEIEDEEAETGPRKMHILPLYSLLPTKEQMKVFEAPPDGSRLVILATNVAETSLTIPGIRYVFDCGRSKERRYDRLSGVQSFEVGWISKASANQRSGRAGRTGPGHCYRLYSSAVYERDFSEFADPELLRMPIEGIVLQLKAMNLQHVVNFPFPTPPDRQSLIKAEKLLTYLSAISDGGQVTQTGRTMSIFPLSPRFARILLVGHLYDCMPYTIALVAGLSAAEVFVPENQAIPAIRQTEGEEDEDDIRTNDDVAAEEQREKIAKMFNAVHKDFCLLDDRSDAIKLLKVVGEFAHEPTEEWCERHFVRFKVLKEIQQLRHQIADLLRTNISAFAGLRVEDKLPAPTNKQVRALKQMVAAGFVDNVAIRADKAPYPPELPRKPRRAIDVPYLPLMPLEGGRSSSAGDDPSDRMVFIHPSSPLAHLSVDECPDFVVYAYLQKAGNTGAEGEKRPKTRMHALTDVTGEQLASLARGTPLITYGKPIKEVKTAGGEAGNTREVWVVPYLRAEGTGDLGWPLPAKKVIQRKAAGRGWVAE